jgi:hypothetical protein
MFTKKWLLFACCVSAVGCSKKDEGALGSAYLVTKEIGPEGGEVEVTDQDLQLTGTKIIIPAGALSKTEKITITKELGAIESNKEPAGPIADFGPDGLVFSKPVTLAIPYTSGAQLARLRIWTKDQGGVSVIPTSALTLDAANKRALFEVEHFTSFQCGIGEEGCAVEECGVEPGLPTWICPDGSQGGPSGQCVRNAGGTCEWEINYCPQTCDESMCQEPFILFACENNIEPTRECLINAAGVCEAVYFCEDACVGSTNANSGLCEDCRVTGACPETTTCDQTSGICTFVQEQCGNLLCPEGWVCCNEECGYCEPALEGTGHLCYPLVCEEECDGPEDCHVASVCDPISHHCVRPERLCGATTCAENEVCCDASCGLCVPFEITSTDPVDCSAHACPACGPNPGDPTCPPNSTCNAAGQCVEECTPQDCGPVPPALPTWLCEDGSIGGWTGNCVGNDATSPSEPRCIWEIRNCTRVCEESECGPAPVDPVCPNGTPGTAECSRQIDGSCDYRIINC